MPINATSIQHIRLTATDIARSRQFYENVFGWQAALEVPADADAATRDELAFLYGGVIYRTGDMLVGLRQVADDRFDENRVGLDHLAFRLGSKGEIDAAAAHLDSLGIAHRPEVATSA